MTSALTIALTIAAVTLWVVTVRSAIRARRESVALIERARKRRVDRIVIALYQLDQHLVGETETGEAVELHLKWDHDGFVILHGQAREVFASAELLRVAERFESLVGDRWTVGHARRLP